MNGADENQQERFSGTVFGIQLPDLIQFACLCLMTVSIDVETADGSGVIHVRSGQTVHAATGAAVGEDAFKEIMLFADGRFDLKPLAGEAGASISKGWEHLLIDAIRYKIDRSRSAPEPGSGAISGFSGSLSDVILIDVVQLACMARTDLVLEVRSGDWDAVVCVRDARIYHARLGDRAGEGALKEILLADNGIFEAAPPEGGEPASIDTPWENLLMEAMRYRDEKLGALEREDSDLETLTQRLQKMKVAEKIRLAITGDKEARTLLMRDSNRMVQVAIISNPRITDGEVAMIASLRSIDEDVLRRIANSREWLKTYQTRLALATNPKCPFPTAARLLQSLSAADLKQVSRSKSVPNSVAQMARRLLSQRL